jgi:hypothetical protein
MGKRWYLSIGLAALGAVLLIQPLGAQWIRIRQSGVPRLADGKPNLKAPTPRTQDGKPDFSGMWLTGNPIPCAKEKGADFLECGAELPIAKEGINMGISLPGGLPYRPDVAQMVKKRTADDAKDDPHARCLPDTFIRSYGLPHIIKVVQTPGLLIMLDELNAGYRQVLTDGRALPIDPQPAWNGYSVGKWEGDTLVVQSIGFRDDLWLDLNGSPLTSAAKVTEKIRRPDYGHMDIELTVEDLKAYTKPWTVTLHEAVVVDTELVDEMCLENEKSSQHLAGK